MKLENKKVNLQLGLSAFSFLHFTQNQLFVVTAFFVWTAVLYTSLFIIIIIIIVVLTSVFPWLQGTPDCKGTPAFRGWTGPMHAAPPLGTIPCHLWFQTLPFIGDRTWSDSGRGYFCIHGFEYNFMTVCPYWRQSPS